MDTTSQIRTKEEIKTPIIEYCLYARKSSEDDERQAMSIDSQINEMNEMAIRDGLFIKEIRKESHSAKMSGQRPVFAQILNDIRIGMFTGILTWAPDRLSRNAGDLGTLVDLMDQGKLQQIKTFSQSFSNNPNEKFLLMILCSQAKLENDQKGINVKRGIRAKCEMGWRPGPPPIGYFNRSFAGVKDIVIDPDRGATITEMFKRVGIGGQSGRDIKRWFDNTGFTTRTGRQVTLSSIYLMLKNPFYYGKFEYPVGSGNWYKGSYPPLITKEVFDKVQKKLIVPKKSKWGSKNLTYRRIFKCFSCGSGIVGEERSRYRKYREPRNHIYYHCSRKKNYDCKELYVSEETLTKSLFRYINFMYMAHPQVLNLTADIRRGMESYRKIRDQVLLHQDIDPDSKSMDLRDYAGYALKDGAMEEKRQLIQLFNNQLYIKDKTVISKG